MQLTLRVQPDRLVVTVFNSSSDEIRLWELENSWGWDSFSFDLRSESGGQLLTAKRAAREWSKNGPTYFALPAGASRDLHFHLDDGWWEIGDTSGLRDAPLLVRATLSIGRTPEAEQFGVFTGTVLSDWVASAPPHAWLPQGQA